MANMTRRTAIGASAGAAGLVGLAQAAEPNSNARTMAMDRQIERYEPSPSLPGVPLISYAVVHRDIVYLSGITASSTKSGDVKDQTRQIVARIDALLAEAGSNKSKLLTAQVWLTDMSLFAAHNDAWNEWVDPRNPPARACLLSTQLWHPGLLVEIMATAAI
ncbi:MAG TPA: RidA family protein [Steroidobacteraceae bacterium]|nr:RidA family protein [Steroidobacteraceae bacterium]